MTENIFRLWNMKKLIALILFFLIGGGHIFRVSADYRV